MSMRLDRLFSIYIFKHLSKLFQSKEFHIPILMYHSISDPKEDGVHPYYRVNTSRAVFAEHIKYLHANQYKVITLDKVLERLNSNDNNEGKYVAITFDDGFRDFYTGAFPILQQYGFSATVFLPTGLIGDQHGTFKEKDLLTWGEVCELRKKGVVFGSHTVTHRQLKLLKRDEVEHEIKHAKETLEDKLGERIESFSYPYAFPEHDKDFVAFMHDTLKTCGYSVAVTTRIGTSAQRDDPFSLKRIPVNTDDDLIFLEVKMAGGYNWMHAAQYTAKSVRGRIEHRRKSMTQWYSDKIQ